MSKTKDSKGEGDSPQSMDYTLFRRNNFISNSSPPKVTDWLRNCRGEI